MAQSILRAMCPLSCARSCTKKTSSFWKLPKKESGICTGLKVRSQESEVWRQKHPSTTLRMTSTKTSHQLINRSAITKREFSYFIENVWGLSAKVEGLFLIKNVKLREATGATNMERRAKSMDQYCPLPFALCALHF